MCAVVDACSDSSASGGPASLPCAVSCPYGSGISEFRVASQRDVVRTTMGSRPGDNLADVLFSYIFAEVLTRVRDLAEREGLLTRVPWADEMRGSVVPVAPSAASDAVSLHDVVWMDDLSLLLGVVSRAKFSLA